MSEVDIINSVAIPVNLKTTHIESNEASLETERLRNRYPQLNTKIENIDIISTPAIPSSVVITEESLTGELPSEYGETRIVVQARDPHWAWAYWEFSSIEQKKLEVELGSFEYAHTEIFLKVFNKSLDYSFEIKLPEGCDNWYLSLNDSDCDYFVQLCIKITSAGFRILATSQVIHLPTDKVSENLAEWVPAKPAKEHEEINEELNDSETNSINKSDIKETIEIIDNFELHKVIEPETKIDLPTIGSSDELIKKGK